MMYTPIDGSYRCTSCSKLLAKDSTHLPGLEIKCGRCGEMNVIFDHFTDQVVITDDEGVIVYANEAVEKTTGYSLAEIIGQRPSLWGGLMSKEFYEDLWHRIKDNKETIMVSVRNRRKDNTHYNAVLRISPILDVNGNAKLFVGVETLIAATVSVTGAESSVPKNAVE